MKSRIQGAARSDAPTGEKTMTPVEEWFAAHDAYHKASDVYNARLELVRAERERGNWTMRVDVEYSALCKAQSKALAADETLYAALSAAERTA